MGLIELLILLLIVGMIFGFVSVGPAALVLLLVIVFLFYYRGRGV